MLTYTQYEDAQLIQLLRDNDTRAYLELYERYHVVIYHWVKRFVKLRDLSEDIVQDTFIKIWEVRHRLQPEQSFPAFLYRISRNRAFKMLKKIAGDSEMRKQIIFQVSTLPAMPEDLLQWQEYQVILNNAVKSLPVQRQKVFTLCRNRNKTYEEVAIELGISRNTVKEHMVKAMQHIRHYFYRYGDVSLLLTLFCFG